MKIIHMIGGGDVGGAKTHVLSLVSKLSEKDDVTLLSFREGEFAEDARKLGIKTLVIKNKNPLDDIKQLKKLLREGGYDIVHCHGAKANVMAALTKSVVSVPIITTVHSDYRLDYMGSFIKQMTNGLMNTVALRCLDGYIGVAPAYIDLLLDRGFAPYKLYAINNGIDFKTPPSPKMSKEEYLKELGIPYGENTVICGIAARFHPVKDIGCAIRAMAELKDSCPDMYLVLGGDGEQAEYLKNLAEELGVSDRVKFAGWITDMDTFLNAVDISIISSVSEGFPYSILESARSKCTMVSTAVGAMPHVISSGENGFLFSVGAYHELAEHLKKLYNSPELRKRLAESLFEKSCREYSFEAMVRDQRAIYEDAIFRKAHRKERRGVLVCGSYGRGNAGDDAILKAVIEEIYSVDPSAEICVMSRNPKLTKKTYRVNSVFTFNPVKMRKEMKRAHLYINGGGSLIQDSTSSRSLWFYLMTISRAKRLGCDVMMYGCGIGPVTRKKNRRLAARIIDKYADSITLRDPDSQNEIKAMGVTKPEMILAADPTLGLAAASESKVLPVLAEAGISKEDECLCLAMRKWQGIEEKIDIFAAAADYAAKTHGLKIVLMPMERERDIAIAEKIKAKMSSPAAVLGGEYDVHTVIGILAHMRIIAAMRLHALVFGAGQGVATIGIAYDHKVTGFMNYIGREMCTQYNDCTLETLKSFIDRTVGDSQYGEEMQRACREMRENEKNNTEVLRKFFKREEK